MEDWQVLLGLIFLRYSYTLAGFLKGVGILSRTYDTLGVSQTSVKCTFSFDHFLTDFFWFCLQVHAPERQVGGWLWAEGC